MNLLVFEPALPVAPRPTLLRPQTPLVKSQHLDANTQIGHSVGQTQFARLQAGQEHSESQKGKGQVVERQMQQCPQLSSQLVVSYRLELGLQKQGDQPQVGGQGFRLAS